MSDPKILLTAEDRTRAAVESAKRGLSELQTKAVAVSGALAGLGLTAFVADLAIGVRATIEEWDELGKAAQRAGFQSAQGIAEFQYAAKLAGVDSAGFEGAIGKLSDKMADAASGGKQAAALFQAMGIRIRDAGGQLRATEVVVADLAKAFSGWKDGPEKTALALELFGKSGKQLIPLLNGGAEGLEKLREEFRLLHGALDDRTNKAAEQFNDNLTRLQTSAGGLKRELADALLPGLVQITDAMVEQAKKGSVLLAVWAGLKEFGKIATNTDDTGNKIRDVEWFNQQLRSKGAQLSLLVDAKEAGGDPDGKLQGRIDRLRGELEGLQKQALAATGAVKQVFNPGYTDSGGTAGDFARMDRAAGGGVSPAAPTPSKDGTPKESAYAAVNKAISERLALQRQELRYGRELTEVEKLEIKASEDQRLSKVAVSAAERKDIESKLAALKANDALIQSQHRGKKTAEEAAAVIGKAYDDEQKAIAAFAETQKKRERDQLASGNKTLEQIEFEISLLTMSNKQREVAIALRDLESQGIRQGTAAWEEYASQITAAVERRTAMQESVDQFKSVWESLDRTAHDVWVNIFEGGSNVFKKLGQVLKASLLDLLYQMTIRKWIISIGASVGGPGAAVAQSALGSAGTSMFGSVAGSALGGLGNFAGSFGSELLGGTLASNIGAGMAGVGGSFASTVGAGLATDAMGATVAANSAAATLGAGSTIGTALAAIPVWGWAAMAAMAVAALAKGGETRSGGKYTGTSFLEGPSGGEINGAQTRTAIGATTGGINAMLTALGATATLKELQSGFEQSERGKGFAYAGGTLSTGATFGQTHGAGWQNRRGNMTAEQAAAAFGEELKQATLQALQAADVPGQLGDYLRSLGDIDALSGGALDAALARLNKALSEKATLEDRYFELTHTALEVQVRDRQRERDALDESNRELYDRITALVDERAAVEATTQARQALLDTLTGGLDDAYQALLDARTAEGDALKTTIGNLESSASRFRAFATDIRTFRDSLLLGDLSPLTPAQRYAESRRLAEETYNRALTGDQDAMAQIPQVASDFLQASQVYNASSDAYQRDFATVQTYLTIGAVKADEAASWAEAQTTIMNAQLAALGTINASVLTVAQAMANLREAGAAAIGSGVAIGDDVLGAYLTTAVGRGDYMDAYTALQGAGRTMAQGNKLLGLGAGTIEDWARYNGLATFAGGGMHAGGARLVGEHGPEIEVTGPSRIFSAPETSRMLGGDTRRLEALVEALRAEVAALRADQRQGVVSRNQATLVAADRTVEGVTAAGQRQAWERLRAQEAVPR